jgi:photosystem II stability/assembly factor-like uncharacterized protein
VDGGNSWESLIEEDRIGILAVHPANASRLYAAGGQEGGTIFVYVSSDGGANWQTHVLPETGKALAIAVHPQNEQTLYVAGTLDGPGAVCRSSDGGATWTRLGKGVFRAPVVAFAVDPLTPGRVYAASDDGVYRSQDSGATWTRIRDRATTALAVDPEVPGRIYSGTTGGVLKSSDFGATWTDFSRGLSVREVSALQAVKGTGTLVASTLGGSLFQIRLGGHRVLVVSASPGGTTSPAPGAYRHAPGARVTITATPEATHIFAGWSGDASGAANPLTVTLDRDLAVRAEFEPILFAPLDFRGTKTSNRSLMFVEYVNVLRWRRNPANDPAATYNLYAVEGGTARLIARLGADALEYLDRGAVKNRTYLYRLAAVDPATGLEGPPAETTVR